MNHVSPTPGQAQPETIPVYNTFGRLFRDLITFDRLEAVSLIHSTVYFALLVSAFLLDGPQPYTFIFGLSHGLIWIGMSIISVLAVRYRVINLRLAVAISVLGCVAPFFGSAEFLRQKHQMKVAER
ncbi:MAG: hypothetical protein WEB05_04410 [Solirubrobacterales bacterium]